MAAANISALVKITVLLHSSMTIFGQDSILDLIKKSLLPQEKILQNCQDFCFYIYAFKYFRVSEGFNFQCLE